MGRAFLTWFNPGPATGYLFAISNLLAALILVFGGMMVVELLQSPMTRMSWRYPFVHPSETSLLIFGYVVFYLGLGKLLHGLVRRFSPAGIGLAVALQGLLVLAGCVIPEVIDAIDARTCITIRRNTLPIRF